MEMQITVSFAESLRNVNQILVVFSLLHNRTDCLSIYIIINSKLQKILID